MDSLAIVFQGDIFVHLFFSQTGLRPVDFWGNCYMSNTTDVELAMIDPQKVGSVSDLSISLFTVYCLRAKN